MNISNSTRMFYSIILYSKIIILILCLYQIQTQCSCSSFITQQVSPTQTINSCDGVCTPPYCTIQPQFIRRSYPSSFFSLKIIDVLVPIYNCFPCVCGAPLTVHTEYSAIGDVRSHYSCDAACANLYCFKKFHGGLTQNIYRCVICPPYCLFCTNDTHCNNCNSGLGYYINSTNLCQKCPQIYGVDCQLCNNAQCVQCYAGYGLNNADGGKSCLPCYNCANCNDGPKCLLCNPGYYFDYSTLNRTCLLCSSMNQCATCTNGLTCLTCNTGYYLDYSTSSKSCAACDPNCNSCINGPQCLSCKPNYYLEFATFNKSCVLCSTISNCATCIDGPICTHCNTNYIIDPAILILTCLACPYKYYSYLDVCYSCVSQCIYCEANSFGVACHQCQLGYTPDPSQTYCFDCKTVTNKCSRCSNMYTCTECEYPYKLGQLGLCDECFPDFQYIEGICTKPTGCSSFLTDYSKCLACFSKYNFVYVPTGSTCMCEVGYKLEKKQKASICVAQCGDGILSLLYEDCDDGNERNNDGCNDNCKKEKYFECIPSSPSQCIYNFKPQRFEYNYAYKYERRNRGKFSFSLYPQNAIFNYVNWSNYLSLNISESFIVPHTKTYGYLSETNEIFVEFDFIQVLENLTVQARLQFKNNHNASIKSATVEQKKQHTYFQIVSSKIQSTNPEITADPQSISLIIKLQGINSALIPSSQMIFQIYYAASIVTLIVTIFIMIQFIVGSYVHKMIGLQTVQIFQFVFFIRIIVNSKNSFFMTSLNPIKYSAYGGYSNFELIYGKSSIQPDALTYMTVGKQFVSAGLMKYFFVNINLPLIILSIALIYYGFMLIKKFRKRNQYLTTLIQSQKDQYTRLRRSSQWAYDHSVFPVINLFNLAAFFCTILYLHSLLTLTSTHLKSSQFNTLIQVTSFSPHLIIVFLTFSSYCYQLFSSYQEWVQFRMTPQEKNRIPQSLIQKLQHDKNDPARPNYKPGYVMIYLLYYFIIEMIIILTVLVEGFQMFGVEILLFVCFMYLIFIWFWNPYCSTADFHNKALRLNHVTSFLMVIVCEIFNRIKMDQAVYAFFIYLTLFFLIIVCFSGYIRIYIEYKFRKKLLDDPNILDFSQLKKNNNDKDQTHNPTLQQKRQGLFRFNKFLFENQIKPLCQKNNIFTNRLDKMRSEQIEWIKNQIRRDIYTNKNVIEYLKEQRDLDDRQLGYNLIQNIGQLNQQYIQRQKIKQLDEKKVFSKRLLNNLQNRDFQQQLDYKTIKKI